MYRTSSERDDLHFALENLSST